MLGLMGRRPETRDGKSLEPLRAHGLEAMSIGFLVDEQQPMAWRGPMVTSALNQLLDPDALGRSRLPDRRHAARHRRHPAHAGAARAGDRRGDRHHAAGHRARSTRARASKMFEKVEVPVLGIVENMACTSARTAATRSTSSAQAAASAWPRSTACRCWRAAARPAHPRASRRGQADRRRGRRTGRARARIRESARRDGGRAARRARKDCSSRDRSRRSAVKRVTMDEHQVRPLDPAHGGAAQ